jgi:hypothetical protein
MYHLRDYPQDRVWNCVSASESLLVIPANAGIQFFGKSTREMDSSLRWNGGEWVANDRCSTSAVSPAFRPGIWEF